MTKTTENKTLGALISLLDEPDDKAFSLVRDQLIAAGQEVLPHLERSLENTFDPVVQERIRDIIRNLRQENLSRDFATWIQSGAGDLLRGFILVTQTQYPDLDEEEIRIRIEEIKMDVWLELHDHLTALENVRVLNHILYDVHKFEGNKDDMTAPQNSYVNMLLESRKGSPLSLGLLFIILGQRLGLPVYGVNLPQHFILAYLSESGLSNPTEDDVLFYINPFNQGAVFTRREIELFIKQMKIKPERSFFSPCSNADIIRRLINNLIYSYNQLGNADKIEDLETLLTAFE